MQFKRLYKELLILFFFFSSVIVLLALVSYVPDDIPFFTSKPNVPVVNKAGIIGAYSAFILFFCFGIAAYLTPFIFLFLGISLMRSEGFERFPVKLSSALGILFSGSLFLSIKNIPVFDGVVNEYSLLDQGGAVGVFLGRNFLEYYLGTGGSLIILASIFVFFVFLLTNLSVSKFINLFKTFLAVSNKALHKLSLLFKFLYEKYSEYRESKNEQLKSVASNREKSVGKVIRNEEKKDTVEKIKSIAVRAIERRKQNKVNRKSRQVKKSVSNRVFDCDGRRISLPPVDLLDEYSANNVDYDADMLKKGAEILTNTMAEFGLDVEVVNIQKGPSVTRYEIKIAPGTKVERIVSLSNNIALAMKAMSVRIIAPIPGKDAIGIEIPNKKTEIVRLREMLESDIYRNGDYLIPLALGKDISGNPVVVDLADMPHLLIAGATGSGKSVCVNSIICTLLFSLTPEQVRFVLIDPKKVELSSYADLPHLYCPIINNSKKASLGLRLLLNEMERRYELFAKVGARNIKAYNEMRQKILSKEDASDEEKEMFENLPYIVTIIDELADLILVSSSDVQESIIRLAQLSRAVGMHLILATQRPSVKVVTGLIKANIPSRISFKLPSKIDSRTVLDANGADKLLGHGDMLFLPPRVSKLIRVQGTFVSDSEIKRIVKYWKEMMPVSYNEDMTKKLSSKSADSSDDEDELFEEAVRIVLESKMASASLLQRRLKIGYNRASRIIDAMEAKGIIGPHVGSKGREIYIDSYDDYQNLQV